MLKSISRLEIFIFLAILAIASFWTWIFLKTPLDDAYVTIRYAQNFLHGHGLVFNVGEHVEGYSSYFCEILTCAAVFLGIPGDVFLEAQSVLFYFLTITLLTVFARKYFQHLLFYFCLPILYVFSLANNIWVGMGLETMLFTFLLLSSLIFYLELNQSRWQRVFIGLWCCLLSLTRPEAVVYYLVILMFEFTDQWIIKKKINILNLLEYSIGLIIFFFYLFSRWKYYGYLMPNTYYQKVGYNALFWHNGFEYLKEFINYNCGGILIFLLAIAYGLIFRRDRFWWLFLMVTLTFLGIIVLSGGNYTPFWRYAVPCDPLLVFLMGDFLGGYFLFASKIKGKWGSILKISAFFLFGLILIQSSIGIMLKSECLNFPIGNRSFHTVAKFTGLMYKEILYPNQSISLNALPFVAYYYGGWVYDPLGLTDAHIAHLKVEMGHRVQSHEKGDGRYILGMRPTILRFEGNLDLVNPPNTDYPVPEKLYYRSDIDIANQMDFKRLYEPYNIFIPAAGQYMTFYKLRNEEIKSPAPQRMNEIYKDTIIKNGRLAYTLDIKILRKTVFWASELSVTSFYRVYRTISGIITLRGVYD